MVMHHDVTPPPGFPRAPTQAAWEAMSEAQRRAVVDALPGTMTEAELHPPEGDSHFDAKSEGRETLRTHFGRSARPIYVGTEITVYYPDEDRFAPDLFAVRDVHTGPREKWVVSAEGRGLEWVLEILVLGDRRKDLERNVVRYARLGIAEYFVYDRGRNTLRGWRLADPRIGIYTPMVPQRGVLRSEVLGMDLFLQDRRLRFREGNADLLAPQEILFRLEDRAMELVMAREEAERQREEAERQREEAERQREEAERQREEAERQREEAERQREEAERRAHALEAEVERLRALLPRG
jgi:hypothetical protein